jgi:predicted transcriptional regulator
MVFNPYDSDDSNDDPRKAKLREQAQKEFIAQLQQRIAVQSSKIEELDDQIQKLNIVIKEKDQELANYSKRVEEERIFFEKDKKARSDREHELQKIVQQLELENEKLKQAPPAPLQPVAAEIEAPPQVQPQVQPDVSDRTNDIISILMAYFMKPTNDIFVLSLKDLIEYSSKEGTIEQKILGLLLNAEKPISEESIVQQLILDPSQINRAIFRLLQKENIKKVGQGYVVASSDFAEMTDVTQDWKSLPPDQIYENLLSVVYVGSDREDLVTSFTKARDALMESGALTTSKTHEISQLIEKIKKYPIESQELIDTIQNWKNS